jgi:hypothetical protein
MMMTKTISFVAKKLIAMMKKALMDKKPMPPTSNMLPPFDA